MCPLRIILVFLSATLAGYFAWRTVRSSSSSSSDIDDMIHGDSSDTEKVSSQGDQEFNLKRAIQNGFWVIVDMASGRYLWRNLRMVNEGEKEKIC
ncbi:PREDICTED: uncharacterized protein LOC104611146 [Nelumbo nucifera]|uniref:Methyltransferase-like protein n=2 Tax=Nelumbo nucifera TaxID=4432 RepID=A0A822YFZ4_NELNU|nr:PREDICTED: uncharacterized protein LOC104611146 [Nelumbo nucifera]DAD30159.1 TPA_asm: hypothetical protein HUJ06_031627 [Nelumbo nucifera]